MHPAHTRGVASALVVPLAAAALLLAGCGLAPGPREGTPAARASASASPADEAAEECREKWTGLADVQGKDEAAYPSVLAPRWTNLVASVELQAQTADGEGCAEAIAAHRAARTALEQFSAKLERFDMQLAAQSQSTAYRSSNLGARQKKVYQRQIRVLDAQGPKATQEQLPGWQQARQVDLGDAKAAGKAVKDLAFLSQESAAYQKCQAALKEIRKLSRRR